MYEYAIFLRHAFHSTRSNRSNYVVVITDAEAVAVVEGLVVVVAAAAAVVVAVRVQW